MESKVLLKMLFGLIGGLLGSLLFGGPEQAFSPKMRVQANPPAVIERLATDPILRVPSFVTSVSPEDFAGVSSPMQSLNQARNAAIDDVVRQILRTIGGEYNYYFLNLISGDLSNPKRLITDRLSGKAHGVVLGVERHIVKSAWSRDDSGKYVYFILVHYPDKLIREMRRISKGAKILVSKERSLGRELILTVKEINNVEVTLSSIDVTVKKLNRFAPFISFCIWKVAKGSVDHFTKAIGPVHIKRSSSSIHLDLPDINKSLKDQLLGAKVDTLIVIKGKDELGRDISAKVIL